MTEVFHETTNGMRQLIAQYNTEFKLVFFEENTVILDGRIKLSEEVVLTILQYINEL